MPHYKDGTEAKVGDLVKGKGYNLKGPDGNIREFVGTLIDITPGASSCNVKIAHVEVFDPIPILASSQFFGPAQGINFCYLNNGGLKPIRAGFEYGQADHFEKIG
jgi:hypothetical protein